MSSKSSPTKKDDKTLSPVKKDHATTSLILTRNQSTFLNTRQLRNKDSSRKKISEFTRQLLGPMKEKKAVQGKKKSPKDKKEKEIPATKPLTVSVTKLVLEPEAKPVAKKRKTAPPRKKVKPAKTPKLAPALPSAQELIDMCEEQSLDDDDLMEILTCESPVWWEGPPDEYEDEMFPSPEEKRYFQEFFKNIKSEPPESPEPETANITIPTIKQSDDKFMKKRSKLENLLGNIKNKLNEPNELNDKRNNADNKKNVSSKAKDNEVSVCNDDCIIKQEKDIKVERTPSECTSSSDEMFFGFSNEDIFRDLEHMYIPIENDKSYERQQVSGSEQKDTSNDADVSNSKEKVTENIKAKTESKGKSILKKPIPEKTVVSDRKMYPESKNNAVRKKETVTSTSLLRSNLEASDKTQSKKCGDSVNKKHNSINDTNSCAKSINTSQKLPVESVNESVKIYFIDTTTNVKENNKEADTKSQPCKSDLNVSNQGKVEMSSVLYNRFKIEQKSNMKSNTQCINIDNNKKDRETNEKRDTISTNITSGDTNQSNEKRIISNTDDKKIEAGDTTQANDTSNRNNKTIESSDTNKINGKMDASNANNKSIVSGDTEQSLNEKCKPAEKEVKSTKPKIVFKDQLLAVYKKITDESYSENLKKTMKDNLEKVDLSICKLINTKNDLERILCKFHVPIQDEEQKTDNTPDDKTKDNKIDVNNKQTLRCDKIDEIETNSSQVIKYKENLTEGNASNIDKTAPAAVTVQTTSDKHMNEIKNEKSNEIIITEDKKDESSKKCDNINEEISPHRTSIVVQSSSSIVSDVKSAKYCLKCSSIFETETCSYCAKKSQVNQDPHKNISQMQRKSNV